MIGEGKKVEKEKKPKEKAKNDRLINYLNNQLRQSPKDYLREVKVYWLLGISFNIIGIVFMLLSIENVLSKNSASTLNLVRVDGARVQEAFDVRREILMKNSLQRIKEKSLVADPNK